MEKTHERCLQNNREDVYLFEGAHREFEKSKGNVMEDFRFKQISLGQNVAHMGFTLRHVDSC